MTARFAATLGATTGLILRGGGCGDSPRPTVGIRVGGNLPRRLVDDEIALGVESLGRAGVTPALFRPPAGSTSPNVVRAAEAAGSGS